MAVTDTVSDSEWVDVDEKETISADIDFVTLGMFIIGM